MYEPLYSLFFVCPFFSFFQHAIQQGCRNRGGGTVGAHAPHPQILSVQLTLSQPEGADYVPPPTLLHTCPPRFSDIPTFLYRARISLHILSILDTQPGQQKTGFNLIFPCCKIRYIPQSVYTRKFTVHKLQYSKASRYAASRCADIAGTRF